MHYNIQEQDGHYSKQMNTFDCTHLPKPFASLLVPLKVYERLEGGMTGEFVKL